MAMVQKFLVGLVVFVVGVLIGLLISGERRGGVQDNGLPQLSSREQGSAGLANRHDFNSIRRAALSESETQKLLLSLESKEISGILGDYFSRPYLMGEDRKVCLKLMSLWAESNPVEFFAWWKREGFPLLEVGAGPDLLLAMAGTNSEIALASIEELPAEAISAKSRAFEKMVFRLEADQFVRALELGQRLDSGLGPCSNLLIGHFFHEEPDMVMKAILEMPNPKDRDTLLLGHAEVLHQILPGKLEEIIGDRSISQNVRTSLAMNLARLEGVGDPKKGLALLNLVDNPAYRNGPRWTIYKAWASQDPQGAMEWARGLPDGPEKWTAYNQAAITKIKDNPDTMGEVLNELPSGNLQRALIRGMVFQMDADAFKENSTIIERIDDAKLRKEAEFVAFSRYVSTNPQEAILQAAINLDAFSVDGRIQEAFEALPQQANDASNIIASMPEESREIFAKAWLTRSGVLDGEISDNPVMQLADIAGN